MNLLLVDDEVAAVNLLKDTIDWGSLGIDEVYCAYNAAFAKQLVYQKEIDICICDIEMPKENGLQLIEWLQKHDAGIVNIILTGHADFNYAQSAVTLNVFRFIVKPVVIGEMESVIREAVAKVREKSAEIRINPSLSSGDEKPPAVAAIENYIQQHYSDPIKRSDIEALVHLNQDYISRMFKEATGYALTEYIQHFRVSMAKKHLIETTASIGEIAGWVGYDSAAYFTKIFHKWTDTTPVEYRNAARKKMKKSDLL